MNKPVPLEFAAALESLAARLKSGEESPHSAAQVLFALLEEVAPKEKVRRGRPRGSKKTTPPAGLAIAKEYLEAVNVRGEKPAAVAKKMNRSSSYLCNTASRCRDWVLKDGSIDVGMQIVMLLLGIKVAYASSRMRDDGWSEVEIERVRDDFETLVRQHCKSSGKDELVGKFVIENPGLVGEVEEYVTQAIRHMKIDG